MEHFNDSVSKTLKNRVKELNDLLYSNINDNLFSHLNTALIYGIHMSGYIPFTDGGYEITYIYSNGLNSSYLSDKHKEFTEKLIKNCKLEYTKDNEINETVDRDTIYDTDNYFEYEQQFFDETYSMVKYYIYIKNDTINIQVRYSYKDTPYHRDEYDEIGYTKEISIEDFFNVDLQDLVKEVPIIENLT